MATTKYISAEGSGNPCRIKVIGVGGGGGNAVNRYILYIVSLVII